jgi:hypothetical protein
MSMSINALIPISEIEAYRLNEQIIKETANQLIKDFAMFGMEILFPENIDYAYHILYEQLKSNIIRLLDREPERLSSLLYQIDVDEKKIKSLGNEAFINHETISHLILEREFLKVLTRHYFSKKNK